MQFKEMGRHGESVQCVEILTTQIHEHHEQSSHGGFPP